MKLIKVLIAITFLFASNVEDVSAQSWFKKVGEKVSNVVGGAIKGAKQGAKKGKTEGAESKEEPQASSASASEEVIIISDYKAASMTLFEDHFSQDQVGAKPAKWEIVKGTADIFNVSKDRCANVASGTIRPKIGENPKNYLSADWTLEFQYYAVYGNQKEPNNELTLELRSEDDESFLEICERSNGGYALGAGINYYHDVLPKSGWNLVQVSLKEQILKVYLNGRRIIVRDCPVAFDYLQLRGEAAHGDGIFIKNFKLSKEPE